MGMKDAKAITKQYASSMRITGNADQQQLCKTKHTFLELKGFTTRPVGKESLLGKRILNYYLRCKAFRNV